MKLLTYRCLPDHPENTRWQSDTLGYDGRWGCGLIFPGKPGPNTCPRCGARYVEQRPDLRPS